MRKTANLRARRLTTEAKAIGVTEAYERVMESESVKWLLGAMSPIDPDYTNATFEQGDRIKRNLQAGFPKYGLSADYAFQGSVSNNTHIRAYSDIDLLVLERRFSWLEAPQQSDNPYEGDPFEALIELRERGAEIIRHEFPAVDVDESGGKSVALTGGSLTRKIDVVTASWWETNQFKETGNEVTRGIKILDYHIPATIENKPFLHNAWIEDKDKRVDGNLRKVARLLKSLKYDADNEVSISSYDIVSIAFNMPDDKLTVPPGASPLLASNCAEFLDLLESDVNYRESLLVPNRMRKVFCEEGAKLKGLKELNAELKQLLDEIRHDLGRSMRKLAEARIKY